jgi:RNA polymerase sigma factor (sigma-70 family)
MSVAVGATYDATIADTNNLHRRVIIICSGAIGAAAVVGWLLAAFAVRPLKRLAQQTRAIDVGGDAPDVEVRGATEAVEIAEAVNGMVQRIWEEQDRTKAALVTSRDFAAVTSHELRTPLTAMRTNLEVLATLDMPEEQRKEVLNDVMLAIWKGAASFDGRSRPSTWIFGIAYHKALKALARRPVEVDSDSEGPEPVERDEPESLAARRELAGVLGRALGSLSPEQRAVVELTYYYGLAYPEIAEIVGCPVNTVKTRMFHARRRLRELLPGMGVSGYAG